MEDDARQLLAQLFLSGGGPEKMIRQKVASEKGSEDRKKNGHERGRRESCEYTDDTDRHGISRRVEW